MTEPIPPERLAEINERHERFVFGILDRGGREACLFDRQDWPCETAQLLAEVDRLADERDEARAKAWDEGWRAGTEWSG